MEIKELIGQLTKVKSEMESFLEGKRKELQEFELELSGVENCIEEIQLIDERWKSIKDEANKKIHWVKPLRLP